MLEKAAGLAADELVLDLEDAVAPAEKDEAREALLRRCWTGSRREARRSRCGSTSPAASGVTATSRRWPAPARR